MAASHGRQPWPSAMAVSHGRQPWPPATAASHGHQPWPPATAASHGRQPWPPATPIFGRPFFRRPNSTFPRFRRISSNETSKFRFSRRSHRVPFFFRPKRTPRGPGRAKIVFFPRFWLLHFSPGKNVFLKIRVPEHFWRPFSESKHYIFIYLEDFKH